MVPAPDVNHAHAAGRPGRLAPPAAVVIFGSTGDLSYRKLLPALYNLLHDGLLPDAFAIVAYGRRPLTDEEYRAKAKEAVSTFSRTRPESEVWNRFAERITYVRGETDDPAGMQALKERLAELDQTRGTAGNRLFYLAVPPSLFAPIIEQLGAAGLNHGGQEGAWARVIIEKPFGHDLASAQDLNRRVSAVFSEDQVFRIDHYLGKETVQNILAFRFANRIWEPMWGDQHIDHVQITVAETLGVEDRGDYYEEAGALRDMVQNHMLQLLSLVAMEPPVTFEAERIRDEKIKVLRAIRPMTPQEVATSTVRGQYVSGKLDGKAVPGYRDEEEVAPDSEVETYVALRLFIDNWRWAGTPFYLRHGKRLPRRSTEIAIQFKRPPHLPFSVTSVEELDPNVLTFQIQPDEGISLSCGVKVPGPALRIKSVDLDFLYGASFHVPAPEAYERLLLDSLLDDHTLFNREDSVEQSWRLVDAIRAGWQEARVPLHFYAAGSWGPPAAEALMAPTGCRWREP